MGLEWTGGDTGHKALMPGVTPSTPPGSSNTIISIFGVPHRPQSQSFQSGHLTQVGTDTSSVITLSASSVMTLPIHYLKCKTQEVQNYSLLVGFGYESNG